MKELFSVLFPGLFKVFSSGFSFSVLSAFVIPHVLIAQTEINYPPLFQTDDLLEVEIRSDFTELLLDRDEDPKYHEAVLSYIGTGGDTVILPTRLRVRGYFRRDPNHCDFPPLWVNFKKEDIKGSIFENQDKLKLVTPCQYEKYVLQEYMIYKMFSLVTDMSYRVRLLKVNYFNTAKNKSIFTRFSYFLEENDLMAARNKMEVIDKFNTPYQVDRNTMIMVGLFEFMIGNKDWFVTSRHNITLIARDSLETPFPVPYDFDMSGLIDAEYRKPAGVPEELLKDTQVYQGICLTDEEQKKAFALFNEMHKPFEQSVINNPFASKSLKYTTTNYLNRFYGIIRDPEMVKTQIELHCDKYQNYQNYKR